MLLLRDSGNKDPHPSDENTVARQTAEVRGTADEFGGSIVDRGTSESN